MMNYRTYVLIGILIISLIYVGFNFNFNLFEEVELQYHDTYIAIMPIYLSLIVWIFLTFITFSTLGVIRKFRDIITNWILLAANSLMIFLVCIGSYFVYQFIMISALSDLITNNHQQLLLTQQLNRFWTISITITTIFFIIEFFLIRNIIKIKKTLISTGANHT